MTNKTCGECRFYFEQAEFCRKNAWECIEEDKECCDEFEKPTIFDRITASPEALAEKLVFAIGRIVPDYNHVVTLLYSTIIPDITFETRTEAIAATVEKLKEVCNE